jgi:dipeptidyl aminopeptidase/acylaminoacyl peptidase
VHPFLLIGGLATALALPDREPARLVFEHNGAIVSMASDGSARRPVTTGSSPVPSPSGDALAFLRPRGEESASIWVSAPDGSQAHELPGSAGTASLPAWSPDGTRIAFARASIDEEHGIRSSIVSVNRDGGDPRTLAQLATKVGLFVIGRPVWTPDGQRVLYTRTRFANRDGDYTYDIHSAAAGGGATRCSCAARPAARSRTTGRASRSRTRAA